MNCDFILGSPAEVERLWFIATNVLTDEQKTLLLMMETVLFKSKLQTLGCANSKTSSTYASE